MLPKRRTHDRVKGKVHPHIKIQSLPAHPHVDGKTGFEVSRSTEHFCCYLTVKWSFCVLLSNVNRWGLVFKR